jgi:EAL domain-containing protein (putative c-di-GMP-specific phosphodiesterase class I)
MLLDMVKKWRVNPELITLEITESAIIVDPTKALKIVEHIAGFGFRISLDDFGTGYSSLSHLSRLPLHELKIDKSFVANMLNRSNDWTIVQATLYLAHNLGLQVVAEGIEDIDVMNELIKLHCESGQGFLIGKPMPSNEISRVLREGAGNSDLRRSLLSA